ncbi:MAG: hypothetical protein J2P37_00250 [Ktedonobacteraceae bacterium]|nr:hypothetical protein [Ktedonobacteraceae bacterium]
MQLEITFAIPLDLQKALVRLALYLAMIIMGMAVLIMSLVFLANLALQVLVTACLWANHLDILTQILLILVLGYVLLKVVTLASRGVRALLQK